MYIIAFFIGFLFWKSCKFWRRLRALDYIWKSGVGFTLFYFTNLFVEILGRKGSGTMIFIVSWCYGGLAMVIFILFWQGSYPPWWHHTGIFWGERSQILLRLLSLTMLLVQRPQVLTSCDITICLGPPYHLALVVGFVLTSWHVDCKYLSASGFPAGMYQHPEAPWCRVSIGRWDFTRHDGT